MKIIRLGFRKEKKCVGDYCFEIGGERERERERESEREGDKET